MSIDTVKSEEIPLLPEEDTSEDRARPDQLALERNCQLIDNFIQNRWPNMAEAT